MVILKHYTKHFKTVCEKFYFPKEANDILRTIAERLDKDKESGDEFDNIVNLYMYSKSSDITKTLEKLKTFGYEKNIHEFTLNMVFLIICSEILLERYIADGYKEELFWLTMIDLRYKLLECMECKHIVGTFVPHWYDDFFKMNIFTLGRFQYQGSEFPMNYITKSGYEIKKGTKCLSIHIPSSGVSLTDEVRFDSYKKAYDFYKNKYRLADGNMIFFCDSWLLYPRHKDFLPEYSNILKFMNDFEIFKSTESKVFYDGWRIFGGHFVLPVQDLPEDTSLRKVYKNRLLNDNPVGSGVGVIVFDGEKF